MLMLAACKVPHTQATSGMQHSKWAVLHNVMYSQRAAEPAACCQASEGKLELVLSWWEVDQGLCQSCTRCRRTAAGGASVQCQKGTTPRLALPSCRLQSFTAWLKPPGLPSRSWVCLFRF